MINIQFPDTSYVQCVFSFRQGNTTCESRSYDNYDHCDPRRLKKYLYRLPESLQGQVQVGDCVLVHCQTGYQLCEVMEINAISGFDEKSVAPVICKVDLQSYFEEIERQQRLVMLRKELEAKKKELEAQVTYDLLAEKSPEFANLLKLFRDSGGKL